MKKAIAAIAMILSTQAAFAEEVANYCDLVEFEAEMAIVTRLTLPDLKGTLDAINGDDDHTEERKEYFRKLIMKAYEVPVPAFCNIDSFGCSMARVQNSHVVNEFKSQAYLECIKENH